MTFQFIACDFKPFAYQAALDSEDVTTVANDLTSQEFTQNYEKERALRARLRGDKGPGDASAYRGRQPVAYPTPGSPDFGSDLPKSGYDDWKV